MPKENTDASATPLCSCGSAHYHYNEDTPRQLMSDKAKPGSLNPRRLGEHQQMRQSVNAVIFVAHILTQFGTTKCLVAIYTWCFDSCPIVQHLLRLLEAGLTRPDTPQHLFIHPLSRLDSKSQKKTHCPFGPHLTRSNRV